MDRNGARGVKVDEKHAVQCRFDGRPLNDLMVWQPLYMKAVIGKSDAHILVHDYASCPRSAIIHRTSFNMPTAVRRMLAGGWVEFAWVLALHMHS